MAKEIFTLKFFDSARQYRLHATRPGRMSSDHSALLLEQLRNSFSGSIDVLHELGGTSGPVITVDTAKIPVGRSGGPKEVKALGMVIKAYWALGYKTSLEKWPD